MRKLTLAILLAVLMSGCLATTNRKWTPPKRPVKKVKKKRAKKRAWHDVWGNEPTIREWPKPKKKRKRLNKKKRRAKVTSHAPHSPRSI